MLKLRKKVSFGDPKAKTKSGVGPKIKAWFQQLSRGLMLPIAILPIAGLLLGIGGAIGANIDAYNEVGKVFSGIFKGMSEIAFASLPILFCVAIAITFSQDKGGAGFSALLAYLVFSSSQHALFQYDDAIQPNLISILWFHKNIAQIGGLVVTNLGIISLNTSIFGGIIIGLISSYAFNYFSKLQLPTALSFFSGIRLVPIVLVPIAFLTAVVFLIFWPWVGQGIYDLGVQMQKAPAGVDGLLYGVLGRALMPFGLHHIPIVLAFQTQFGGVLSIEMLDKVANQLDAGQLAEIKKQLVSFTGGKGTQIVGDQNIWNFINGLTFNNLTVTIDGKTSQLPIFSAFKQIVGVNAGKFTQDYPTYLGTCMGIGAAMIFTSDKEHRKVTAATIGSTMVVAFLTGITEPLEFSFLFVAPIFYYLVYVPLSGLAYMFMTLVNAHVGVGFARGFIDLIIYGAIPVTKGTNFYWAFVFALIFGVFAFAIFYFWIKKANLATPGRNGNTLGLINKKQYQELKAKKQKANHDDITPKASTTPQIEVEKQDEATQIIAKLGGKANLASVSACATRLRITQKQYQKLDNKDFVEFGSFGLIQDQTSVQIIFGGKAAILADRINTILNQDENK